MKLLNLIYRLFGFQLKPQEPTNVKIAYHNYTLPYDGNSLMVKPVFDAANNILHYQTDPFVDVDGKLKIKRVSSHNVIVEKVFHLVEEIPS